MKHAGRYEEMVAEELGRLETGHNHETLTKKEQARLVEMQRGADLPLMTAPNDKQIGYLVSRAEYPNCGEGWGFLCLDCNKGVVGRCPFYGVNLNPYKAVCVDCKRVIIEGCGTELLSGR